MNVVDQWFKSSMSGGMGNILADGESLMYDFLDRQAVEKLQKEHKAGRNDNHKLLFSLIVLEQWLRTNQGARSQGVVAA